MIEKYRFIEFNISSLSIKKFIIITTHIYKCLKDNYNKLIKYIILESQYGCFIALYTKNEDTYRYNIVKVIHK